MDLKNIKDMPVSFTERPLKNLAPVQSTEKHSRVLKNTWDKGLEAENQVIQFLKLKKYEILYHRFKTPFAEIDLVVKGKERQLVIIEVKKHFGRLNDRPVISEKQKQRLKRATQWITEHGHFAELWLAVVGQDNKIQFFQDVFD